MRHEYFNVQFRQDVNCSDFGVHFRFAVRISKCFQAFDEGEDAAALARTLMELRRGGVADSALQALLEQDGLASEDRRRLEAVSRFRQLFEGEIEGRFADPTTLLRAASERVGQATWLAGAQFVLLPGLKLEADECGFIETLGERFEVLELREERPAGLAERKPLRSVSTVPWSETPLAPAAPEAAPQPCC